MYALCEHFWFWYNEPHKVANQWQIQNFPEEVGVNQRGQGRQPIIWQIFAENYMKMKEYGPRVGGACVFLVAP